MTTDPIAAAIDHIRSVTPADNPWTADDVSSFSPWEPDESDYAIATILNAVVAGQLINRASRDEMLAQVRRGEGFATAGAEGRWIADSDAGVYDADAPDPIAAARAPERIWIEAGDDCPYFYEGNELHEAGSPVTEYVRADLVEALKAENQRLRATLSAITATDCYSREECTAMARAALRGTEASHDD